MKISRTTLFALVGAASLASTGTAHAQDDGPIDFKGGVTFLTDYRLRGASLSDNNGVMQGNIEATVPLGENFSVFGGVWASTLDKNAGAGAVETDIYAGAQGKIGDISIRARYLRLVFYDSEPADIDFDQYEVGASAPIGPVTAGIGAIHDEYANGGDSTYVYTSAAYTVPKTDLTLKGLVGYEDGSNWNNKLNWALGAFYTYKGVTFGANYIDTNRFSRNSKGKNRAGDTVVLSIGASF